MGIFDFFKRKVVPQKKSTDINTLNMPCIDVKKTLKGPRGVVHTEKINLEVATFEMAKKEFISFDVETTGLNALSDRIVELGAVRFENGIPVKSFSTLVNPGIAISSSASAVNHITNAMLQNAPDERSIYPDFIKFLGDAVCGKIIMCAHNAKFDFDFLSNTLSRLGLNAQLKYIDTLPLARRFIPGLKNYQQCTIGDYLGLKNETAHRAESDAEICGKILSNILDKANENIDKEKRKIASLTPNEEELEVCAYIQKALVERNADVSWIRYRKNSGNYVDITCLYTFLKFKFAKKGKYVIVQGNLSNDIDLPFEVCTVSEGGADYRRVYFDNPRDLAPLMDYFYTAFSNCFKSMNDYIAMGEYERCSAEESIKDLKALSDAEVEKFLVVSASRKYNATSLDIKIEPTISITDVVINAIHNRCSLNEIRNIGNWDKGFQEGFKYWEKGETVRKDGRVEEAIALYDKARYNGYEAPALYTSYATAYRQLKDYDNEIVIIEEFLSRNKYGKDGTFIARRDKAISLLYKKQQAERKAVEKQDMKLQKRLDMQKEPVQSKQSKGKAIIQLTDDGMVVQEYETVTAAANAVGISTKSIRDAAQGVQKHAGGFCWKYKEQIEKTR